MISSSNITKKSSLEDNFPDLIKEATNKNKAFSNDLNSFKPNAADVINTSDKTQYQNSKSIISLQESVRTIFETKDSTTDLNAYN